jgi:transposase
MALQDCSGGFGAGALYGTTPGATCKSIAAGLGINRATPREWVPRDRDRRGTAATAPAPGGRMTARAGRTVPSARPGRADPAAGGPGGRARDERKPATGRETLRRAAGYFAGETNWW